MDSEGNYTPTYVTTNKSKKLCVCAHKQNYVYKAKHHFMNEDDYYVLKMSIAFYHFSTLNFMKIPEQLSLDS